MKNNQLIFVIFPNTGRQHRIFNLVELDCQHFLLELLKSQKNPLLFYHHS